MTLPYSYAYILNLIQEPSPAIKLEIRICHVNFLIRKFGNFLKFPNSEIDGRPWRREPEAELIDCSKEIFQK